MSTSGTSRSASNSRSKSSSTVTQRGSAGSGNKPASAKKTTPRAAERPVLLAGDNPQIPKAEGNAPVQAYIAAIPGWKRSVAQHLDGLIVRAVPNVRKAVKWNSPFYGVEDGEGWFLNFHCFTKYIKVAFFRGTSLRPLPPGESKHAEVRYVDIHENKQLDQRALLSWIRQASKLLGVTP